MPPNTEIHAGTWTRTLLHTAGSSSNQTPLPTLSDETLLRLLENRRDQKNQEEMTGEASEESRGGSANEEKGTGATRKKTGRKTQLLVKAGAGGWIGQADLEIRKSAAKS